MQRASRAGACAVAAAASALLAPSLARAQPPPQQQQEPPQLVYSRPVEAKLGAFLAATPATGAVS